MDILECKDYRDYLKFQVDKKKESTKSFSYQSFATKIGVSKSYLKLLVEKKTQASIDRLFDICQFFKLTPFETQYLIFLFLQNTSQVRSAKNFFTRILRSFRLPRVKNNSRILDDGESHSNIKSWVLFALCNLTKLKGYQHKATWIQQILGGPEVVSVHDIAEAMIAIENEGYVFKTANGWQIQKKDFRTIDIPPWDGILIKGFTTGLKRAAYALDNFSQNDFHNPCRYHMYAFRVSEDGAKKMAKAYDRFQKQLETIEKESKANADRVLLVSNNMFRITRKIDDVN